ncbi:methyltransferase family protein [Hephaestia sp. GCM10023244]|uniref:methyltransferase family protein n=1 Tax=unclassified Hephaestia TaxID=2631281 RepID=UPI0020770C65|nr:isoprenylcysteine carboxylmethyltransferase family protein [Hephaestia sp. MAHUQ-44]MCM8730347.1 isoprenylcysteine carboxylmethyltransferase family protein [Hephaestia sp. MAHUQ-44]
MVSQIGFSQTGLPAFAALALGELAFVIALVTVRLRRGAERGARQFSLRSTAGIAGQAAAFAILAVDVKSPTLDPLGAPALVQAAAVALLMAAAVGLFVWATRTMGRNWSIVARTREDHQLVTSGPFAYVRHPIYAALALMLLAFAIGLARWPALLVALPLYALATGQRVVIEERLLRTMFGAGYDTYAGRVKRFVPGLF